MCVFVLAEEQLACRQCEHTMKLVGTSPVNTVFYSYYTCTCTQNTDMHVHVHVRTSIVYSHLGLSEAR